VLVTMIKTNSFPVLLGVSYLRFNLDFIDKAISILCIFDIPLLISYIYIYKNVTASLSASVSGP
jgi:hypothetical protein